MKIHGIEWSRVAEPQADGYDTEVALMFAREAGFDRQPAGSEPTAFDGAVAIREDATLLGYDGCQYAPPDHPNLRKAEALLRCWPTVYKQCQVLLDTLCLYDYPRLGADQIIGSVCGPGQRGFGSILVTVNHHMGLAEGIVHEMAHHKLRALGIGFEEARRLLLNDPNDKYPSPIRYDCLRPMSAVLHAQYSYTYIAQLDLMVLKGDEDKLLAMAIRELSLAVIVPKLQFGVTVIKQHARTDNWGDAFVNGFMTWCQRVIDLGLLDLRQNGVKATAFTHPIAED